MAVRLRLLGGVRARVFAKGRWRVLWPSLNRPERGGGAVPRRQWPSMAISLDCQSRRGKLRGNFRTNKGGVKAGLHANLIEGLKGERAR
jgi:hypothetical protein